MRQIADILASNTNAIVFDDAGALGVSLALTNSFLHRNHAFHQDIPLNFDLTLLTEDPKYVGPNGLLVTHNFYALTMVIYLLPSETLAPEGMASTSVLPSSHGRKWTQTTKTYACTFKNCSISIFPSHHWHSVSPNPGFIRASVVNKILLVTEKSQPALTWNTLYNIIQRKFKNILQETAIQETTYSDMIDLARERKLSNDAFEDPYLEAEQGRRSAKRGNRVQEDIRHSYVS